MSSATFDLERSNRYCYEFGMLESFFLIEIGPNHGLWVVCEPKGSQYDQYWFSHNDLQVRGRIRKIDLNCGLIIAGLAPKSKVMIRLDHLEH